jgi:predicted  nucleic acid-binding Zn-ribbon protein
MMDVSEIIKLIITLLGGFIIYYLKKLVDEVGTISKDINEIKEAMNGTSVQVNGHEKRLDRIESRIEQLHEKSN